MITVDLRDAFFQPVRFLVSNKYFGFAFTNVNRQVYVIESTFISSFIKLVSAYENITNERSNNKITMAVMKKYQ